MAQDDGEEPPKAIPAAEAEAVTVADSGDEDLDLGQLEFRSLSRGLPERNLKGEAEEADHYRSQTFKDHFELMAIFAFWAMFVVFMAVGLVWALHLVAPQWGWLTHEQTDDLQGLLAGGVIAGVLADHVRRRMT